MCRAVAVRVAEHAVEYKEDKSDPSTKASKEVQGSSEKKMALPPVFPIVIDETAVEDILGVNVDKFLLNILNKRYLALAFY